MTVTDVQGLLIWNTHVIDFGDVNGVLTFSSVRLQKLSEFLVDVFQGLILSDPLVEFAFDLFDI